MKNNSYFGSEIKVNVLESIWKAKKDIYATIAWFNDEDIFNALLKMSSTVKIHMAILKDAPINRLNYKKLSEAGVRLYKIEKQENELMHHKFCVIDGSILITGSYNWTYGATHNRENILIIEDDLDNCAKFIAEFNDIVTPIDDFLSSKITEVENISADLIAKIKQQKNLIIDYMHTYKELPQQEFVNDELKKNTNYQHSNMPNLNVDLPTKPHNSLVNFSNNQFNQNITYSDWWNNLPVAWKYFFNEKYFDKKSDEMPDKAGINNLFHLTRIDCDGFSVWAGYKGTHDNQYITTLEPIRYFFGLTHLFFSNNKIESIDSITHLNKLLWLSIRNNQLKNLIGIENLSNLSILHVQNNPLTSLEGIEYLSKLNSLRCDLKFSKLPIEFERIKQLGFNDFQYDEKNKIMICSKKVEEKEVKLIE